jgi:hypothetical protein
VLPSSLARRSLDRVDVEALGVLRIFSQAAHDYAAEKPEFPFLQGDAVDAVSLRELALAKLGLPPPLPALGWRMD